MGTQPSTERHATTRLDQWIEGASVAPATGAYLTNISPLTGQPTVQVADGNADDVGRAADAAHRAAPAWRALGPTDRGRLLMALADRIRAEKATLAALERADTGKPQALAEAEIDGTALYFEFYASLVYLPVGEVLDVSADQHVFTRREPFGVVGVITPWNLPMNQAARAIAPALVAGNTIVAKPSEVTPQTTVALGRLAAEVGFPPGVLNIVLGSGGSVGEALVSHPAVRKVAFTGSVATGRAIGRIAAERIIPLTLELGGKSANIIFADADLDTAATEAVKGFTLNAGQVCSAGTRLLVQRAVYDQVLEKVAAITGAVTPGENLGPIITRDQYQRVQTYFEIASGEGVRLVIGGTCAAVGDFPGGYFIQPTIFADVANSTRIAQEEIFGPVLVVIPFEDEAEAIEITNQSNYGLIGTVWTRDISRALRVADQIEAGQIFVNTWNTMSVITPFGGHKNSGYGREKGIEAIHHYTHLKTVTIKY